MAGKRSYKSAEIRAYIKGRCRLGLSAKSIFSEICEIYGHNEVSYATVTRWAKRFKCGQETLQDNAKSGRRRTATSKENISKIQEILQNDARLTVREIAHHTGISLSRVHLILKKHLGFNKICARWIPHLLDNQQKRQRVSKAKKILKKYPQYSRRTFSHLITGDETWIHYYTPRTKQCNRVWLTRNARRPVIAKRTQSVKKVLYAVFFTNTGPAIQVPVPKSKSVTGRFYRDVVLKKLEKYCKKRRPASGLKYMRLLHDNAPPHKAEIVKQFLKEKRVTVLDHPPYSPDLAPCDYFLFPKLKCFLQGRRYYSRKALGSAVFKYLNSIPVSSYERCFKSWILRLKKCVKHKGDYFEGQK